MAHAFSLTFSKGYKRRKDKTAHLLPEQSMYTTKENIEIYRRRAVEKGRSVKAYDVQRECLLSSSVQSMLLLADNIDTQ